MVAVAACSLIVIPYGRERTLDRYWQQSVKRSKPCRCALDDRIGPCAANRRASDPGELAILLQGGYLNALAGNVDTSAIR